MPKGVYDSHGNMWQWWPIVSATMPAQGISRGLPRPRPPARSASAVAALGGWPLNCTTSVFRGWLTPAKRCGITGFRAARTY